MLFITGVVVLALIGNVHPYKFHFRSNQETQQPEEQKPEQVDNNSDFPVEHQSLLQQPLHPQQPYYTMPLFGSLPSLRTEQQQLPLASLGTKGAAPIRQPAHSRQPQALAYVIIRPIQPQYQFLEPLRHDRLYPQPLRPVIPVYRDQQESSSSAGGTKGGQREEIPEQHQQLPLASKGGRDERDELHEGQQLAELQQQQQQLPLQQQKLSGTKGGRDQSDKEGQQQIFQQKQEDGIKGQRQEGQGKGEGQGQGQENQQESFEEVKKGKFQTLKAHLEHLAAAAKAKMTFSSYEYVKEEIVSTEKPQEQEQEQVPDREVEPQQEQLSQQQLQEIDEGRNQQAPSKGRPPIRQPVKEPQLSLHQQFEQQQQPLLEQQPQQLHDDGFEATKSKDLPPREQQRLPSKGQEPRQPQQPQQIELQREPIKDTEQQQVLLPQQQQLPLANSKGESIRQDQLQQPQQQQEPQLPLNQPKGRQTN